MVLTQVLLGSKEHSTENWQQFNCCLKKTKTHKKILTKKTRSRKTKQGFATFLRSLFPIVATFVMIKY